MLIWIFGPESVECTSVLHQPDGVGSQRRHIVPVGELNGVLIDLVACLPNLPWASSKSAIATALEKITTTSPSTFDGVRMICNAVSRHCGLNWDEDESLEFGQCCGEVGA
ncbi:hypothetical protein Tco_0848986 [Tanacetum coccineum]